MRKIEMDLTRQILEKQLPDRIFRETIDRLSGTSLEWYEQITKIMVDEYKYYIEKTYKTPTQETVWILIRNALYEINNGLENVVMLRHNRTEQERLKEMFDWVLPHLKNQDLKPIFIITDENRYRGENGEDNFDEDDIF